MEKIIGLIPTRFCNFNCEHCGVNKSKNIDYASIKKTIKFLDIAKEQGFNTVRITGGGEPFIRYDKMVRIIKEVKKRGMKPWVVTNGSFLIKDLKRLEELKKNGLYCITFSIDKFHLEFISYDFIIKVIKKTMEEKIKLRIKSTYNKKEDLKILNKIKEDLDAKIILYRGSYFSLGYIKTKKCKIILELFKVIENEFTKTDKNEGKNNLKEIALLKCPMRIPIMENKGYIIPCCSFNALNYTNLYEMGNIKQINSDRKIDEPDPFLKKILYERFAFVDILLTVRKDKELLKKFQKYYQNPCDLCYLAMKNKDKIINLGFPKKREKILFLIRNLVNLTVTFIILSKDRIIRYLTKNT